MGLCVSLFLSSLRGILNRVPFGLPENVEKVIVRSLSFASKDCKTTPRTISLKNKDCDSHNAHKSDGSEKLVLEESLSFKRWESGKPRLETSVSFKDLVLNCKDLGEIDKVDHSFYGLNSPTPVPDSAILFPSKPDSELEAAAVKLQKFYKSYRTRRNLADCAVVVEELWWKALDFAALKRSSVSFFKIDKQESAISRWARARTRAAKVGKGLSKDEKAQKLALRHWLEAIDPRHRYGHNLHMYYNVWFASESTQPFFYWLDVGDGKEVNLEKCPRTVLQRQCIMYLTLKEREAYEVVIENGRLVYKQSGELVNTSGRSKWIFVLSTMKVLYVGQKKKGLFQHSSFLAGGATTAAGRLVAHNGILEAIWPYSGHYRPTEENFMGFINFLEEHHVDLTNVKRCAIDDDVLSYKTGYDELSTDSMSSPHDEISSPRIADFDEPIKGKGISTISPEKNNLETTKIDMGMPKTKLRNRLSSKWTTGAGPRISCVREYPQQLQCQALEQVNLSPRSTPTPFTSCGPIPSPRPSPRIHLSPSLVHLGLPSPRV